MKYARKPTSVHTHQSTDRRRRAIARAHDARDRPAGCGGGERRCASPQQGEYRREAEGRGGGGDLAEHQSAKGMIVAARKIQKVEMIRLACGLVGLATFCQPCKANVLLLSSR